MPTKVTMVSRQVQFPPGVADRVRVLAAQRGCSEAEVYRMLVDSALPALEKQYRANAAEVTQDLAVA